MTYSESAKGIKIDLERVEHEFRDHGCLEYLEEFLATHKADKNGLYSASVVLRDLGY